MAATVGLRELKNSLSAYVRRVRAGERVQITDRGHVVAELVPPQPIEHFGDIPAPWIELARQGKLRLATQPKQPLPRLKPLLPLKRVLELLDEERADRI